MIRSIQLGPFTLFADDSGRPGLDILQNGFNYESHIVAELRRLIPQSIGFLDIGANLGIHTLIAKTIKPSLPIVSAECSSFNLDLLCCNIAFNKLTDITILPFALSSKTGLIRTNECKENMCCSPEGLPDSTGYPRVAPAFALDDLNLPPIDLIKIDIEGMEIAALRGASKLLKSRPRIIFEYCPELAHRSNLTSAEVLNFFLTRGYRLTTLDYIPGMRATFTNADKCLNHIRNTSKWIADILAESSEFLES